MTDTFTCANCGGTFDIVEFDGGSYAWTRERLDRKVRRKIQRRERRDQRQSDSRSIIVGETPAEKASS